MNNQELIRKLCLEFYEWCRYNTDGPDDETFDFWYQKYGSKIEQETK